MTNPEYKKLATERTIYLALAGLAKEYLLPHEGEDTPPRRLDCEELPRNDSLVSEDAIIDVVLKLQSLARSRELRMSKFKHVETDDEQEWEEGAAQSSNGKGAAAAASKGTGKGGGARPPAPAAQGGGRKPAHPGLKPPNGGAAKGT